MSKKTLFIEEVISCATDAFCHPVWTVLVRDLIDVNSRAYKAKINFSLDSQMCLFTKYNEEESHIVSGFCIEVPPKYLTDSKEVLIPIHNSHNYDNSSKPEKEINVPLSDSMSLKSLTLDTELQQGFYLAVEFPV